MRDGPERHDVVRHQRGRGVVAGPVVRPEVPLQADDPEPESPAQPAGDGNRPLRSLDPRRAASEDLPPGDAEGLQGVQHADLRAATGQSLERLGSERAGVVQDDGVAPVSIAVVDEAPGQRGDLTVRDRDEHQAATLDRPLRDASDAEPPREASEPSSGGSRSRRDRPNRPAGLDQRRQDRAGQASRADHRRLRPQRGSGHACAPRSTAIRWVSSSGIGARASTVFPVTGWRNVSRHACSASRSNSRSALRRSGS